MMMMMMMMMIVMIPRQLTFYFALTGTTPSTCADVSGFPCQSISGFKLCDDDRIADNYCRKTCGRCGLSPGSALIGK